MREGTAALVVFKRDAYDPLTLPRGSPQELRPSRVLAARLNDRPGEGGVRVLDTRTFA